MSTDGLAGTAESDFWATGTHFMICRFSSFFRRSLALGALFFICFFLQPTPYLVWIVQPRMKHSLRMQTQNIYKSKNEQYQHRWRLKRSSDKSAPKHEKQHSHNQLNMTVGYSSMLGIIREMCYIQDLLDAEKGMWNDKLQLPEHARQEVKILRGQDTYPRRCRRWS